MKRLYFLIVLLFPFVSCVENTEVEQEPVYWIDTITCDFENYSLKDGRILFLTDSNTFDIQSISEAPSMHARSGKHAFLIEPSNTSSLFTLTNLKKNQLVEISIWQKDDSSSSFIEAKTTFGQTVFSKQDEIRKAKKGWIQHFISIPIKKNDEELSFRLKTDSKVASFDDLDIKIYPVMPVNNIAKQLNIYIPNTSKSKLNNYIDKALDKEVIPASSKKYVKAFMIVEGDTSKLKIKLKGDWTDHIKPDKASYRIKLDKWSGYENMRSFSIQHPKTRNFINEWVLHHIAEKNDVLTTTYDFVNVTINDYYSGVYAIEEHFDKHVIENRKRREGPILKFDEAGVWAMQKENRDNKNQMHLPFFESSVINVFKKNRTLSSPQLFKQFDEAKKLLQLFKDGYINVNEIFDIDQLAKYYAIVELSGNYHALAWHNRRFYYNPVTQQLETILFDVIPYPNHQRSIMMEILTNVEKDKNMILDNAVVLNEAFKEKYFHYIKKYSSKTYLDTVFNELEADISLFYPAIKGEKEEYRFSKKDFYDQAQFIVGGLKELNTIWNTKLEEAKDIQHWMKEENYYLSDDETFVFEISINSYFTKTSKGKFKVMVENYHLHDVMLTSYTGGEGNTKYQLLDTIVVPSFQQKPGTISFIADHLPKSITFSIQGKPKKEYTKEINPWSLPQGVSSRMQLMNGFFAKSDNYSIIDNVLTFGTDIVIDKLLYIPENYEVIILPGSSIEFKNGGGLIITNSLTCMGDINNPISFICNDKSSNGITILNGGFVNIAYTTTSGLSNLNYQNWTLTGAITIYETPTKIDHLTIDKNYCEDALNIIRSEFEINGLEVSNTYSDGFDADFCTGYITESKFTNTGNDCIDFSGSSIDISKITIVNSGDKGVSAGERSELTLKDISINGSLTGVASKDASSIIGSNISLNNTKVGFAAFQKKATYGAGFIDLSECKFDKVEKEILVEKKSTIIINNKKHIGVIKLDIEKLYSQFNKK